MNKIRLIGIAVGVAILLCFYIYVFATYGNRPITEVPIWVLWLFGE